MLTPEQLTARKEGIGGSDIAAVCGLSRWRSPMDVYLDKIGATEPLEQNEAMYWGNKLEASIGERFAEDHPEFTVVPWSGEPVRVGFALATPDAMLYDSPNTTPRAGLEIKTASAWKKAEWDGENIPNEYMIQCQWYMHVMQCDRWYLAVLVGGNDYREFIIDRDQQLIDELLDRGAAFWSLVENKTPPAIDGSDASKRVLDYLYPADMVIQDVAELPAEADEYAMRHLELKQAIKESEQDLKLVDNKLKELIGEKEEGVTPSGYRVPWKPRSRTGIDSKRLKDELPDVAEEYSKTTTYRQLDVKEADYGE